MLLAGCVFDGVLNIAVPQEILNQPRIGSLIGQSETTPMTEHMGGARGAKKPPHCIYAVTD